ncbi:MBL fold metallo-hydrolase [Candidimonas sp. SYP-B2681]|uniref:MBL fold metallo-hydrolase n=1 Tax=Candidimonas sp. SYP-B2681 TaxID=2497686 RepID=UPI000F878F99|nr:MBL fold metallo-hydrolase [Candidimonas sp. SYP-B2681]RTZ47501.1 MBL fold metallo-hydrolase [Candidimonas sp. SYP-B2681]
MPSPDVEVFFDKQTCTFSYVVHARGNPSCAIIDSVLDYNPNSGRTTTTSADQIIAFIREKHLHVQWILETHAHADHVSASHYLKTQLGGQIAIGAHITEVQQVFKRLFNLDQKVATDGSQFDRLFHDQETFSIGDIAVTALHVPGHTAADMAYCVENLGIFIGDTLFMPDVGTARCDFPGGDAGKLFDSIQKILALGDDTRLYLCHDYPPQGREAQYCVTVKEQRQANIHVHDGVGLEDFSAMRTERDKTLDMPVLILPAIQINIRAGRYPEPESNGIHYLKIPLNQL